MDGEEGWGGGMKCTRHAAEQRTHWGKTNKELTSFKIVTSFVCLIQVRLLLYNDSFVPRE